MLGEPGHLFIISRIAGFGLSKHQFRRAIILRGSSELLSGRARCHSHYQRQQRRIITPVPSSQCVYLRAT